MAKVRFLSSALDGQTVTLSATQGAVTRGPNTVSEWGVPMGDPWSGDAISETLTVTVNEVLPAGDQFAPLGVEWRIRVTGTSYTTPDYEPGPDPTESQLRLGWEASDPSFQRCHFMVHTGDSGNYRNDWVGHTSHRNKAFQYGQVCGHVYSEPGTYTGRRIYVYDDEGNWGTLTLDDLVVTDPDDDFDAASTIVIDTAGDFSGAPHEATLPAANKVTTLDAAMMRFNAIRNSLPKGGRICARAGSVFNEKAEGLNASNTHGRILVDTFGGTDRAAYSERDNDAPAPGGELFKAGDPFDAGWSWTIRNWSFDMGFDTANGRPSNASGWSDSATHRLLFRHRWEYNYSSEADGLWFIYDNLDITGTTHAVFEGVSTYDIRAYKAITFINDCLITDVTDYVIYNLAHVVLLGTKLTDTFGNDIGGYGRSRGCGLQRGYRGHPILIRETGSWSIYIRGTYAECRGGWFGLNQQVGCRGSQRLMRLNNNTENFLTVNADGSVNGRGKRYYFCDSVLMGTINLGAGDQAVTNDTGESISGEHVVIENCMLTYNPFSGIEGYLLQYVLGRRSVRNCQMIVFDSPRYGQSDFVASGRNLLRFEVGDNKFGGFDDFAGPLDDEFVHGDRLEFVHNTAVMFRPTSELKDGTFTLRRTDDDANYDVKDGHNVLRAPNVDTPIGPAMTAIDLPAGMRVLDVWLRFIWERQVFTLAAPVADQGTTPPIPYPDDWYNLPTTGADYAGTAGNNSLKVVGGDNHSSVPDDCVNLKNSEFAQEMEVNHDLDSNGDPASPVGTGTHFTITNTSGETWAAGSCTILLDRGDTAMAPDTIKVIDQSEFKLFRPTSNQPLDPGVGSTLFDFNRDLRPNAGFAISPDTGTNTAGAILPA